MRQHTTPASNCQRQNCLGLKELICWQKYADRKFACAITKNTSMCVLKYDSVRFTVGLKGSKKRATAAAAIESKHRPDTNYDSLRAQPEPHSQRFRAQRQPYGFISKPSSLQRERAAPSCWSLRLSRIDVQVTPCNRAYSIHFSPRPVCLFFFVFWTIT